jgi:hypothetical protein
VPDSPATQLVRQLVAQPPRRLSELEAIVGPIAMSFRDEDLENMGWLDRPRGATGEFTPLVPRLSIRYQFDMYHETPSRPRDVGLESFTLVLRGDAASAEQVLRDKLGLLRTVVDGDTTYAAFHPFYVARDPATTGRFRFAWYAEVPRFAIPEPDVRARTAWLRALARRIASARTVDEVDAFCKHAPTDAGIEIVGTVNVTANPYGRPTKDPRDYWIKFVPPVRALVVAEAFDWGAVIAVSHDVHMSSWYLERRGDTWLPTSGADAQWEVTASLASHPSGDSVRDGTSHRHGRELAPEDELYSLTVGPRFK